MIANIGNTEGLTAPFQPVETTGRVIILPTVGRNGEKLYYSYYLAK